MGPRILISLIGVALIAAACGGNSDTDDGETTATATPSATATTAATATPTATATDEPAAGPDSRPATQAQMALDNTYNTAGTFDPQVMGIGPDDVRAQWYQADGFYVVVFDGLDLNATGPICPGASVQIASGAWEWVSNAPAPGADCTSFSTLTTDPDVGVLVCQGVVSYRTAIPASATGNLYGTIERLVPGGYMGLTSITPTTGTIPEVDLAILSC